jgi:hypothetical protein
LSAPVFREPILLPLPALLLRPLSLPAVISLLRFLKFSLKVALALLWAHSFLLNFSSHPASSIAILLGAAGSAGSIQAAVAGILDYCVFILFDLGAIAGIAAGVVVTWVHSPWMAKSSSVTLCANVASIRGTLAVRSISRAL